MIFHTTLPSIPFSHWFWHQRANRLLLLTTGLVMMVHFIWFKFLYPFPNIIPDSYRYIIAATSNTFVDMRPIGYSRFLRVVSCFTTSHTMLVLLQFLLLQGATLYFLFTVGYLFKPGKWVFRALVILPTAANPVLSHVSNLVSSDALFTALSIIWFTQLLWMQYRPSSTLFAAHALVLLLAFTVRYNALWYPVISVLAIFIAPIQAPAKKNLYRLGMIVLVCIPLTCFVLLTIRENKRVFALPGFSAFSGWQLAANGLVVYDHLPLEPASSVPKALRPLHLLANKHIDSLRRLHKPQDSTMNIYYMWDKTSPLNIYMPYFPLGQQHTLFVHQWISLGPLYKQYGDYLIKKHPGAFVRYFILPNTQYYFFPNPEFLGIYGAGSNTVGPEVVSWFKWKSNRVRSAVGNEAIGSMRIYVFLQFITNLLYLLSFIGFLVMNGFKGLPSLYKNILWLSFFTLAANMAFSIGTSLVVLRYQVFAMLLMTVYDVLLLCRIIHQSRSRTS